MSQIAPIDAVQTALDLLPSQYVQAVKLRAYLSAIAQRFQSLDDVIQQLQAGRSINDAEGVQLDHIGQLVGQARFGGNYPAGESDAAYRPKIRARGLANHSQGTAEDIIAVLVALLGASLQVPGVKVTDCYPASFVVNLFTVSPLTDQQIADCITFIKLAKPNGVRFEASWSTGNVFAFDGFPAPPAAGYDVGAWAHYFYL